MRKGFWKQPPLIWDANPEQVRILNPYYMEVTAAKLLNLPMRQPRKVKQVRAGLGLAAACCCAHAMPAAVPMPRAGAVALGRAKGQGSVWEAPCGCWLGPEC